MGNTLSNDDLLQEMETATRTLQSVLNHAQGRLMDYHKRQFVEVRTRFKLAYKEALETRTISRTKLEELLTQFVRLEVQFSRMELAQNPQG